MVSEDDDEDDVGGLAATEQCTTFLRKDNPASLYTCGDVVKRNDRPKDADSVTEGMNSVRFKALDCTIARCRVVADRRSHGRAVSTHPCVAMTNAGELGAIGRELIAAVGDVGLTPVKAS